MHPLQIQVDDAVAPGVQNVAVRGCTGQRTCLSDIPPQIGGERGLGEALLRVSFDVALLGQDAFSARDCAIRFGVG